MVSRWMVAVTVVAGSVIAGSGCCGIYPYGGYGLGCGYAGCDTGVCSLDEPCCESAACDQCTAGGGDWAYGGGAEICDTCGAGVYPGVAACRFLCHVGRAIHNALTCGAGCGDLYVDEWLSDPPDAHDPCIDCARENLAPPGCGVRPSVPLRLWGTRFHDDGCPTCGGGQAVAGQGEYVDAVVEQSEEPSLVAGRPFSAQRTARRARATVARRQLPGRFAR